VATLTSDHSHARSSSFNAVDWIVWTLVVIGAINWGLVGAFEFDLVAALLGQMSTATRIVYVLVGIDRDLVARAITNLLGNALKFSPAGSSVRCAIEPLPLEWAVLVQDQGPGIDEELRAHLFEPFARGRAGFHVEGAGLGLAFVKTVAQRHGGKVVLESAPGQGSAFRLILPRA
jgi:signal transduction histidine kinase